MPPESPRETAAPRPSVKAPATPKPRPDPRPMRLALGAGTIAALSMMTAGLVRFPVATVQGVGDAVAADAGTLETIATARPEVRIKHKTVYVQLKRGQKAPRGAKVIDGAVPTPRVVVTRIPAQPATTRRVSRPAVRRVVAKTRQSGH
jgi:hypothetical protein